MLKTFFYIPADKPKFLEGLNKFDPDYFILDLEDSLTSGNSAEGIKNLNGIESVKDNYFVRVGLESAAETVKALYPRYKKIKLPKIESSGHLRSVFGSVSKHFDLNEFEFIISIESPKGVINLGEIFRDHTDRFAGVSIGTHDYCKEMNAAHETVNFNFMRNSILNYCKAYGKFCLDFASMNITDAELFKSECLEGFRMGFDGKPVLHPWQLNMVNGIRFYDEHEIEDAVEVYRHFAGRIPADVPAVKINNRIIEKPHLKRLALVIKYIEKTNPEIL